MASRVHFEGPSGEYLPPHGHTADINTNWGEHIGGDRTPVAYGIKVVLGTNLGRTHDHPLTRQGLLVAIDRSGESRDATFDDLGDRVIVMHVTAGEMAAAIVAAGGA